MYSVQKIVLLLCIVQSITAYVCPDYCDCIGPAVKCTNIKGLQNYDVNSDIKSIDISGLNLADLFIDFKGFSHLLKLNASHNSLTKIVKLNSRITSLDLSHNVLKSTNILKLPVAVEYLDLSHNEITNLPKDMLRFTRLKRLALNNNPIACDCEAIKIRNWIDRNLTMADDNLVRCATPVRYANQTWLIINELDVCDELMLADSPANVQVNASNIILEATTKPINNPKDTTRPTDKLVTSLKPADTNNLTIPLPPSDQTEKNTHNIVLYASTGVITIMAALGIGIRYYLVSKKKLTDSESGSSSDSNSTTKPSNDGVKQSDFEENINARLEEASDEIEAATQTLGRLISAMERQVSEGAMSNGTNESIGQYIPATSTTDVAVENLNSKQTSAVNLLEMEEEPPVPLAHENEKNMNRVEMSAAKVVTLSETLIADAIKKMIESSNSDTFQTNVESVLVIDNPDKIVPEPNVNDLVESVRISKLVSAVEFLPTIPEIESSNVSIASNYSPVYDFKTKTVKAKN